MPDYIYLLENRLSAPQQNALRTVRDLAREAQKTVFLTGGAVRDLTCGNPVRDLEVTVHGNVLELKSAVEKAGGKVWGVDEVSRTLYLCFPGNVRLDLGSARRADFPKSGKPVYEWTSIQEDLRARDFTVNAMAISLNEGSYGLLMDPTNGVADIEARHLRLVSNYGFLENPVQLIRATRLKARLAFELEERTHTRYENAKGEDVIEHLSEHERSRELEQIGHEEEPLKVLHALEAEGWMQHLFAAWTAAKADVDKLTALHDLSIELQVQGVHPDVSAAQMQLLTAKLAAKDLAQLKKQMLRPGFVEEWNHLDAQAADFAKVLLSKENATPSATYNLFTSYAAEAVLWLGFTSKQAAVKEKYENFLKVWPQARQRVPYALMLEMRITPELPGYNDLVKTIFLQLIDGGLTTNEEIRALLEPHSPPAPPPPVTIKRTRAKKGAEAKKARHSDEDDEDSDDLGDDEDEEDGLDLDGEDLDFSIGADDARIAPAADGDEDDVFARDSVGDDDLDSDGDRDADTDVDPDDEPTPPAAPRGRKGRGTSKAASRSESTADRNSASGAGLRELAEEYDLVEPDDPADLDEADPSILTEDLTTAKKVTSKGQKATPIKSSSAASKTKAAVKVVAKAPVKAPVKVVAKSAAKPAPAKPVAKVAAKPASKAPVKAAVKVVAKAVPAKKAVAVSKTGKKR
ncbi:tRNA nucleotidyltransferase/poly(A) polymerase family protein [Acidicapsa ligni]|uniref:CCA tRNA nucleotidyltransferase n=1 Tax=Acidicapsa ligni TaxID=542300 RepID=UPI0021DFF638|nr:CCA tRNA nucleotidyltransferase [Acidicapsa ligni]